MEVKKFSPNELELLLKLSKQHKKTIESIPLLDEINIESKGKNATRQINLINIDRIIEKIEEAINTKY